MSRLDPSPAVPVHWAPTPLVRASLWVHGVGLPGLITPWWPYVAGALLANHAVLAVGLHPRAQWVGPTLIRLPPGGAVALTFDDGPDPDVTPHVLDILDAHGARASFFCIGSSAAQHPALVRDILRRGHTVANHTWSHPAAFAAYGMGAMRREVGRAQAVLADITGAPPRWMRAPAGLRTPLLEPVLAELDLRHVSWARRAYDSICRHPATVTRRLVRGMRDGDILMLHDGRAARTAAGQPVVLEALPGVLAAIKAAGWRAVPLAPGAIASPAAAEANLARA